MKQYILNKDKRPPQLQVVYTDYITNHIQQIIDNNQGNINGLSALGDYIDWVSNHVSNRAIAFDYGGNFAKNSDGMIIIYDKGISFYLVDDSDKVFVEIVGLDLNLEEFGLCENKKVNISRIITETINSYLRKNLLLAS